jgi:hypothetical protein
MSRALYARSGENVVGGVLQRTDGSKKMDDLLAMLYGSYGERLIVSYKRAS